MTQAFSETFILPTIAKNAGPPSLYAHNAVSWNKDLYILNGITATNQYEDKMYKLDVIKRTWSLIGTETLKKPRPRQGALVLVRNDSLYVIGGLNNNEFLCDFWEFSFKTNQWTQMFSTSQGIFPNGIAFHSGVYREKEDALYVMCGRLKNGLNNTLYRYKFKETKWEKVAGHGKIPSERDQASIVLDEEQDYLFVYGGENQRGKLDDLYRFDITNEEWVEMANKSSVVPPKMRGHIMMSFRGSVIIHGGSYASNVMYEYDIHGTQWYRIEIEGNKILGRDHHSVARVAPGRFIVFGGYREDLKRQPVDCNNVEMLDLYHFKHRDIRYAKQSAFVNMLSKKSLIDVEFMVQGKTFSCHSPIACRSPYLRSMIESQGVPTKIEILGAEPQVFADLLTWLYESELVKVYKVIDLCKLAREYGIFDLVAFCCRLFKQQINASNIISLFIEVVQKEEVILRHICQQYIYEHFTKIMTDSENVMLLSKEQNLLQEVMLLSRSEKPVSLTTQFTELKNISESATEMLEDFLSNLFSTADKLRDVDLIAQQSGRKFSCHSVVLSGVSPLFLNAIEKLRNDRSITIKADDTTLALLVEYAYTNTIKTEETLKIQQLKDLALIGHEWLPALEDWSITQLLKRVSKETCSELLVACASLKKLENIQILKQRCKIELSASFSKSELAAMISDLLAYPEL